MCFFLIQLVRFTFSCQLETITVTPLANVEMFNLNKLPIIYCKLPLIDHCKQVKTISKQLFSLIITKIKKLSKEGVPQTAQISQLESFYQNFQAS